ncbi:MAG: DUF1934 domain-containing protein [Candidatus Paraimprobicoccus trichonymphae]|uniref:DUF1934 domain-containing protein n=1 Tax=Candidatus Paraimprobicoccus trichonymphae TaxID=3033793 RepID=A0AA48KZN0_9FIRM|nr:MAG: DUF1934 domain-containing protein [Candidatus Paraimprobicoccus trichonymphae]
MQENYLISIIGNQMDCKKIKVETVGNYVEIGYNKYIIYREYEKNNLKKFKVLVLKIENSQKIIITRSGRGKPKLVLEKNKRHHCFYSTEYGFVRIGLFTDQIELDLNSSGGSLKIKYFLDINHIISGLNEICIKVRENNVKNID